MHQQHRAGNPIDSMQRGASPIGSHRLGIGANQPIQLVRLELGGLLTEGLQIGNAEPAGADGEEQPLRGERAQGREATGAFAANHQAVSIRCRSLTIVGRSESRLSPLIRATVVLRASTAPSSSAIWLPH